jgi:pantothenate kinase
VTEPHRDIDALCDRALALARSGRRVIIGVAGPPGAGKSTLAKAVVAAVRERRPGSAALVPMDGFHLADVQLGRLGLLDRKGAPETFDAAGYAVLLERIRADDEAVVYAPDFDRELEQPIGAAVAVDAATRVVVTEGNYLLLPTGLWPRVRASLDEVWFAQTEDAERVERLIARHVEFGKPPDVAREWVLRSDEANASLVAGTRWAADLVVEV